MGYVHSFAGTDEEFRNVQLNLLKEFHKICQEEDIKYFAIYGTLLGAVRHRGFIPWDDDIDVAIFRKDVKKLKKTNNRLDPKYRFIFTDDTETFNCNVIRFMDTTTTCINLTDYTEKGHYGILIDVLIIDNTYQLKTLRELKNKILMCLYDNTLQKKNEKAGLEPYLRLIKVTDFIHRLGGILPVKKSIYAYKRFLVLESKWLKKQDKAKFENLEICIPHMPNECLTAMYGKDYMVLPPKEKQVPHHITGRYIDTEKSYKEVIETVAFSGKLPKDKALILWGAGNMAKHYFKKFGNMRMPEYVIDNNSQNWNKTIAGCKITGPDILEKYKPEDVCILICNIYYCDIIPQIEQMGTYQCLVYCEKRFSLE